MLMHVPLKVDILSEISAVALKILGPVHFADNHFADAVLPTDCFADRYFLPTGYFLPTVTIC
jgi:hypothetical protein